MFVHVEKQGNVGDTQANQEGVDMFTLLTEECLLLV